jgi:DNA gyrase subunit A
VQAEESEEAEEIPDYPVHLFVSKQGYLKKILPNSLRMSGEQKFKEGDSLAMTVETTNRAEVLVFTDKQQCYKTRLSDFVDSKASLLGDYLPTKLEFESDEKLLHVIFPGDYKGHILFFFENGKAAKVPLSAYETKTNRKKLTGAFSDKSPLVAAMAMDVDDQVAVYTTDDRCMIFSTAQLLPKTTRNTQGVSILSLKKKATVKDAQLFTGSGIVNASRYRTRTLPGAGAVLKSEDAPEKQIQFEV